MYLIEDFLGVVMIALLAACMVLPLNRKVESKNMIEVAVYGLVIIGGMLLVHYGFLGF